MSFLDLIKQYFYRVIVIEYQAEDGTIGYVSTESNSVHELKNFIILHAMGENYSMLIQKHSIISMEVI